MRLRIVSIFILVLATAGARDGKFDIAHAAGSTFVVTSSADDGGAECVEVCTLRQAITAANSNGNPTEQDRIEFAPKDCDGLRIQLSSVLPDITEPVVIAGTAEPGSLCADLYLRVVDIDATGYDGIRVAHSADASAFGTEIRGIYIHHFGSYGIALGSGTGHRIENSGVGVMWPGLSGAGGPGDGILVEEHAIQAQIGGPSEAQRNYVVGADGFGIRVLAHGTRIEGNAIGLLPASLGSSANLAGGIGLFGVNNVVIGGTSPASGNTIQGNDGPGIIVEGGSHAVISHNTIGLNLNGGIVLRSATQDSTVNGTVIAKNDVFSNRGPGISISFSVGAELSGNRVGWYEMQNQYPTCSGNQGNGIMLDHSSNTTIGTLSPNVISCNSGHGLLVADGTNNTVIQSNIVGLFPWQAGWVPNREAAIGIEGAVSGVTIGGTGSLGNRILAQSRDQFSSVNAIEVKSTDSGTPQLVGIHGNSIRSDRHAINLVPLSEGPNEVTPNDGGFDPSSGPNGLQDFPTLLSATSGASPEVAIEFEVPPGEYLVQFYASEMCNTATSRQAWRFVDAVNIFVSEDGEAQGVIPLDGPIAPGEFVTATATRVDNGESTSELSNCVLAAGSDPRPTIQGASPDSFVAGTLEATFTVTGTNFTPASVVTWNGHPLDTTFISSQELVATVARERIGVVSYILRKAVEIRVDESDGLLSHVFLVEVRNSSADVSCDGRVDAFDALQAQIALAGFDLGGACRRFDANLDGVFTLADVHRIRQEIAGLIDSPSPQPQPQP